MEGIQLLLGYEKGNFVRPTILVNVPSEGDIAKTEIFGPVLGLIHVNSSGRCD